MANHPKNAALNLLDGLWYASGRVHDDYDWLRAHAPVFHDEANDVWALTSYEDLAFASKSPELFCSGKGIRPHQPEPIPTSMINLDDPRHKRRRMLINRGFTPNRVTSMEGKVRTLCRELIGKVAAQGSCEFVSEVAAPLTMIMIGDLLGVRPEDREQLLSWSENLLVMTTSSFTPQMRKLAERATTEYAMYTLAVVKDRRANDRGDLMSALVRAEVDGERLTDQDLIWESMLILIGGNDTTRHTITGGMEALIRNPDARKVLREDPSVIPLAIEEMLRWVSPIHNMARTTTTDVEIGGEVIPKGSSVLLMYAAANRDERVFEQPHRFDIRRNPNRHVAFGGNGAHFCLGAALARLELRVMFEEILRGLPDAELMTDAPPPLCNSNFIVGIRQMPIRFAPPC